MQSVSTEFFHDKHTNIVTIRIFFEWNMSIANNIKNNLYKNNADLIVDITIDIKSSEDTLNEKIGRVVQTILPLVNNNSDDCIQKIEPLTGGE